MLRSSLGALGALLGRRGASQTTAGVLGAGNRTWARRISYASPQGTLLRQSRTPSSPATWRQRFGGLKSFSRPRQTGSPFGSARRSFHSSKSRNSQSPAKESTKEKPEEALSLSARLRKLSREYGWAAVGVYLALTVLDFPLCFLLVRTVGTDKIGELEHYVVSNVQTIIPQRVKNFWHEYRKALKQSEMERSGNNDVSEDLEMAGWGVKEADERNRAEASLATQLAFAYAIHKSFIFVRVPLTAAVTPKVVRVLRSWGWEIGKRRAKR